MTSTSGATLSFFGATGTVTGSRYLIEHDDRRILVDCGLFQGYKQLRLRNRAAFPVPPESIDAVVLTHAHIDHSGFIPALVKQGFEGPVYSTPGTAELCSLLLPDSASLLEEEADYARRKGYSKHSDPAPLYTVRDAEQALKHFITMPFDEDFGLGGGQLSARFIPAGHILGAAQVHVDVATTGVHFSGDLGRSNDALMQAPRPFPGADVLVVESTYGDRAHPEIDAEAELGDAIAPVLQRGGVVIIPAFAVGRAQSLLLHIMRLQRRGSIPQVPLYLNSPMAVNATRIYEAHPRSFRIGHDEFEELGDAVTLVRTVDESKLLNQRRGPMIIVSASGMLTGGRVLHHVEAFGDDPRNAIVLSGFQAGGTRGAALAEGAETLRMFGRDVPIRAEVIQLSSMSSHADADELLRWMSAADQAPRMTYVTHGEPNSADVLRYRIEHELGWPVRVPEHMERVEL